MCWTECSYRILFPCTVKSVAQWAECSEQVKSNGGFAPWAEAIVGLTSLLSSSSQTRRYTSGGYPRPVDVLDIFPFHPIPRRYHFTQRTACRSNSTFDHPLLPSHTERKTPPSKMSTGAGNTVVEPDTLDLPVIELESWLRRKESPEFEKAAQAEALKVSRPSRSIVPPHGTARSTSAHLPPFLFTRPRNPLLLLLLLPPLSPTRAGRGRAPQVRPHHHPGPPRDVRDERALP
jgi:hypothetical protein